MVSKIPAALLCSYPCRPGNRVRPLIDGVNAFRRICEAVETATNSVWITVAFLEEAFQMPDGRGSFFAVIEAASQRGIDVKVIFWRSPELESTSPNIHFHGESYQRTLLETAGYTFQAQWDCIPRVRCHHQKSWLIDAGTAGEVAFVGGINLGVNDVVEVGHAAINGGSTHDVYCELAGPAATDVHHNFVQRWNETSERGASTGRWPADEELRRLPFPVKLSPQKGTVDMQIGRTVRRDLYCETTAAVGHEAFAIAAGEKSILEQYLMAIQHADQSIYIEDRAIASLEGIIALEAALKRGVEVTAVPQFVDK